MLFHPVLLLLVSATFVHCKMFLVNTGSKGPIASEQKKQNSSSSSGGVDYSRVSAPAADDDYPDPDVKPANKKERILQGQWKDEGLNWKVSLKIKNRRAGEILCAGAIVDTTTVITAASCIHQKSYVANSKDITVYAYSPQSWSGRELTVDSVEVHPRFREGGTSYDLAVIRLLAGQVDMGTTACLPTRPMQSYLNTTLQIGGFGADKSKPKGIAGFEANRYFSVQDMFYLKECLVGRERALGKPSKKAVEAKNDTMNVIGNRGVFCAGDIITCYGDGGSPIFTQENEPEDGCLTEVLLGVARNIYSKKQPCEKEKPGAHMSTLHTSIFYHLYGDTWLCQQLGWRTCQ